MLHEEQTDVVSKMTLFYTSYCSVLLSYSTRTVYRHVCTADELFCCVDNAFLMIFFCVDVAHDGDTLHCSHIVFWKHRAPNKLFNSSIRLDESMFVLLSFFSFLFFLLRHDGGGDTAGPERGRVL